MPAGKIAERLSKAFLALRAWWRGASDTHAYDSYLLHAEKTKAKPLTAEEFYLDQMQRKYSRPNRCC